MTPPPQLDAFLATLDARNASPHTRAAYARDLADAWGHLAAEGLGDWTEAQPHHLRGWLARRHGEGLSPRTLARRLAAVRALFRFLRQQGLVGHDPGAGLKLPRATRHLPGTLEPEPLHHLLDQPADDPLEARDLAMLELMYGSGLRLAEVCGLAITDIDPGSGEVRVLGKGQKTRIVPIGDKALAAVRAWLKQRPAYAAPGEVALFVSQRGAPIAPRTVQARLSRLARKHGLAGKVHPHMLRHACASHFLQNSGDLRAVQELLGHSSLSTTQIYTHLDFQHLAQAYDAAHPRARRNKA
ncbi:MAG: tyrosine recombinase XerC [Halothiobacillaceae bacterium]|nr:MAG: tyrosine recombinase XerC [Halothiobacillaceae bacterium]